MLVGGVSSNIVAPEADEVIIGHWDSVGGNLAGIVECIYMVAEEGWCLRGACIVR